MNIIGNVLAAGGFVYAGVLMVSCMVKSVREILTPQETEHKNQQEKPYRVVKVRVKSKTCE